MDHNTRVKREGQYQTIVKGLWIATSVFIAGLVLLIFVLSRQDLPTFDQLENPQDNYASTAFFSNGERIGRYYIENRIPVDYEDLNVHLVNALIATEDARFYGHSGIDSKALMRVGVKTVLLGQRSAGGGSTITQQLAKLLYSDRDFRGMNKLQKVFALLSRKIKEWITAVKLEKSYTKEEIIAMYLNHFDFIYGAHGVRAASETYFGKNQDSLSIEEAATIVGMLKNPSLYNPKSFPENAKRRRSVVLNQMKKHKYITADQYEQLKQVEVDMSGFSRKTQSEGPAPYFRFELRKTLNKILASDECRKPDGEKYDIFRDGLKIYTTLDPVIQKEAEDVVLVHMPNVQKKFWRVWKNLDPWTHREEDTTNEQIEIRQNALTGLVERSDRFQSLLEERMEGYFDKIEQAFFKNTTFRLHHFKRILKAEKDSRYISNLLRKKIINEGLASAYSKVLASEIWPEVRSQWEQLNDEASKIFSTPVKMKVFAYNDALQKDTTMTPLDSIKYHRMFLQMGSVGIQPNTGAVKFWVGGIDHKFFKYDHVTSDRQVGSTFKPFLYATAIAHQGISPCQEFIDQAFTISPGDKSFDLIKPWSPGNSTGSFSGKPYNLKRGLRSSVNSVSVQLMYELGDTEPVREIVNNMGLDKNARLSNGRYKIPRQPSICLGSMDLKALELAGAYCTFANNGVYNTPFFIQKIENREGHVVYERIPEERTALNPKHNYVMMELLKYASAGTLGVLKSEYGGKTGTTNDFVDAWYVGVTPDLVVGTWVGGEDRWIRFLTLTNGAGGRAARPYFKELLKRLEENESSSYDYTRRFKVPPGKLGIELDCDTYKQDELNGENEEEEPDFYEEF